MSHAITPTATRAFVDVLSTYRAQVAAALPPAPPITGDADSACAEDPAATYRDGADDPAMQALAMAVEIADEAARSDIECACRQVVGREGLQWYDIASVTDPGDRAEVMRACQYLVLRGDQAHGYSVHFNPAFANLIRFEATPRTCRSCGCTDTQACEGGCSWAGADLCSRCEVAP